jgi:flagella basal body P-ring formation protein FlgA
MPGTEPQGIIMEPEGLIGKVAIKNLHKDMPITPNEISDLTSLPNWKWLA